MPVPARHLSLCIVLTFPPLAIADGFFEDSSFKVLNRNFYMRQDFRNDSSFRNPQTAERKHTRAEWANGVTASFESGFTPGPIGLGLDIKALLGWKLDGGNGQVGDSNAGNGLIPRRGYHFNGKPKDDFGKVDAALKIRLFEHTELRYGDYRPASPVINASDTRLLPQSFRGAFVKNTSIKGLTLEGGKVESGSDRSATAHNGDLGTAYGGRFKDAEDFIYGGADYKYDDRFFFRLHHGRLDNVWNQTAFYADWIQPLNDHLSFNTGFKYIGTRDTGKSLLGDINNDSWSAHVGLTSGAHALTLTHTRIDDDSPFDYLWNTWDFFLNTGSQISDFNNPNERTWMLRYDYDFAALGVPGLKLITRYLRGTDIDGRDVGSGYAAYQNIRNGRHWERDVWISYVVQSGSAKDLTFRILQATHRVNGDHTAEADIDELRLIVEYPLSLL
ncbi:outer membrane OprD family porin [Azomonas agilis]|uniref:Outer membrane OprD family porin n=1 Tax=Azomonas agilis TaxID=116849 RepID=A0A562IZ11_9GAMM|nr:OprD family porin [Azomonas agilis]TWH75845.1 outer membrane OprD family porin [Azomonas agilis]